MGGDCTILPNYSIEQGLLFALVFNGYLLLIMVAFSPRVWGYSDYSKEIKAQTSTRVTELKTSVKVMAGPPVRYKAICSKCRTEFKLPFKPTDGRPVYCLACLKSKRRADRGRRRRQTLLFINNLAHARTHRKSRQRC